MCSEKLWGFPGGSVVKNPPMKQETRVRSLGHEDPLEEEMTTHSSILTWEIPWTEELGRLQSMGLQRIRYDFTTQQQQRKIVHEPMGLLCWFDKIPWFSNGLILAMEIHSVWNTPCQMIVKILTVELGRPAQSRREKSNCVPTKGVAKKGGKGDEQWCREG